MINVHSPDELNCVSFVRCTNVCSAMNYLAFRSCFKKKLNVKSSHKFSFSFHWEFFSDFRKWSIKKRTSIKESYTSFKNNNLRIYYCLTRIPCTDLEDFVFDLFGFCRRQFLPNSPRTMGSIKYGWSLQFYLGFQFFPQKMCVAF